jgi:ABC-type Zn uptake system ZnuABC Zn-binding protein ZnuA
MSYKFYDLNQIKVLVNEEKIKAIHIKDKRSAKMFETLLKKIEVVEMKTNEK